MFTYTSYIKTRKRFMRENKNQDFVYLKNDSNVLVSAPHGVPQTRLGKVKHEEIGSVSVALELNKRLNTNLIVKTANNFDDVNFDERSPYKSKIRSEIEKGNVKYIIDFHGLAKYRDIDINLGINLGKNIHTNVPLYEDLLKRLKKEKFVVSVDNPFCGGAKTIAGTFGGDIWTIQVELNYDITNNIKNKDRLETLLNVFESWMKTIK